MWKNLRDVGAIAQKISAVVAPPPGEHDDDDSDDDDNKEGYHSDNEGIYSADDRKYYANDDTTNEEDDHGDSDEDGDDISAEEEESNRGPFGFVDMLRRTINESIHRDHDDSAEEGEASDEGNESGGDDDEMGSQSEDAGREETQQNMAPEESPYRKEGHVQGHSNDALRLSSSELKLDGTLNPSLSNFLETGSHSRSTLHSPTKSRSNSGNIGLNQLQQSASDMHNNTASPASNNSHPFFNNDPRESSMPEPAFLELRREKGSVSPRHLASEKEAMQDMQSNDGIPDKLYIVDADDDDDGLDDDGLDDDGLDDDEEEVDFEHTDSPDEESLSDHSDLDAKSNDGPRIVRRLQQKDSNLRNDSNSDDNDERKAPRRHVSSARRIKKGSTYSTDSLLAGDFGRQLREQRRQKKHDDGKTGAVSSQSPEQPDQDVDRRRIKKGPTYSTDSLLQGDFGRQLREQRRQKRRGDGKSSTGSSRSPSPEPTRVATVVDNRPRHRIVEVPKNDLVLLGGPNATASGPNLFSDDEQDELDVPLHKGRQVPPLSSPKDSFQPSASRLELSSVPSPSAPPRQKDDPYRRNENSGPAEMASSGPNEEGAVDMTNSAYDPMRAAHAFKDSMDRNGTSHVEDSKRIHQLEVQCNELRRQLEQRENQILDLQQQASRAVEQDAQEHERLVELFQQKQQQLLDAAAEDHKYELRELQQEMTTRMQALQTAMEEERNAFQTERDQVEFLLNEAIERADKLEQAAHQVRAQGETSVSQLQQQHARVLRTTEDKLVEALAMLDEKVENEEHLKATIKTLQSKMSEHHEGAQEVEEELEEIHSENEQLLSKVEKLETEKKQLREKVSKLQADSEKLTHLKLEMRMLKEDNEREKSKRQTVAASAESTSAQLIADRDAALSDVQDLKQQLAAARADIDVCKSDMERIMISNNNLQSALEAFQMEREAELAIWEENKVSDEKALIAAHEVAMDATRQSNEAQIQMIQNAADLAVRNSMDEIKLLEEKLEMIRLENVQMRRSLDEAISRLQVTQDDVIDRSFMKNVLFDWLTNKGVKERRDVLEVMANILHFTEDEKEQVHIGHGAVGISRIVGSIPEPKADMEHLEGENVREKWVNFLLAETDD